MTRRAVLLIGCGLTVLGLAGALVGAGWPAPPSAADHDEPLEMHITDAQATACRNGAARWRVGVDMVARGVPGSALSGASLDAAYVTAPKQRWHAVPVTQHGEAIAPGHRIGPTGQLRLHPNVEVVLPCTVSAARLVAAVRVSDDSPRHAQAQFVDNGIAMSVSAVGGLVLLGLVAVFGLRRLTDAKAAE